MKNAIAEYSKMKKKPLKKCAHFSRLAHLLVTEHLLAK
jgi:hypothetical protein